MAELKTKQNNLDVNEFLNTIEDEQKRADSLDIVDMMKKVTGAEPKMWGTSIIGFGETHLKYKSGRDLDWFRIGFSPRKQNLSLYVMGYLDGYQELLDKLGKYKTGKGCLYIKRLSDVNLDILEKIFVKSAKKETYE
ncbi:MAG: DUF1801 domain-containing protein [Bacteroidales bacterium]|nr:DUF1801 domain-containing protein [Bacteroidales bacterium]